MTKNRLLDKTYDDNGNMIGLSYDPATFDVENRMVAFKTDTYDYAPDNKRIYKYTPGTNLLQEVYFYAGGRKIATYTFYLPSDPDDPDVPTSIQFALSNYNIYFGGKLIVSNGQGVVLDRLGSVVARAVDVNSSVFERHSYFPYGEERTSNGLPTANNRDKFGTYFRDASTGLDYADQRYYSSQFGRFASSDPYQASGGTNDPSSWNRYGYVGGDPINRFDQSGTCWASVSAGGTTSSEYYDCTSLLASSLLASSTPYKPPSPTSSLAQYVDVHPSDALDIAQARKAIGQDVKLALAALGKKDCSKHFGTEQSRAGSWDPKTVLSTIFSTSGGYVGGTSAYVGFAVYKSYPILAAATVGPAVFAGGNTGGVAVGFRVDINAQNWNDMGVGTGNIGLQYQAAGLLHEMGHIYSALDSLGFGSGGSDMKFDGLPWQGDTSNENNALILKDCFGITN
jgi:RHS repeat-associated protein